MGYVRLLQDGIFDSTYIHFRDVIGFSENLMRKPARLRKITSYLGRLLQIVIAHRFRLIENVQN
jgi:hypothetical protein